MENLQFFGGFLENFEIKIPKFRSKLKTIFEIDPFLPHFLIKLPYKNEQKVFRHNLKISPSKNPYLPILFLQILLACLTHFPRKFFSLQTFTAKTFQYSARIYLPRHI